MQFKKTLKRKEIGIDINTFHVYETVFRYSIFKYELSISTMKFHAGWLKKYVDIECRMMKRN